VLTLISRVEVGPQGCI